MVGNMMKPKNLSLGAIVIIFIALFRTVMEPIRSQHFSTSPLCYDQIFPYLLAAAVEVPGLAAMLFLHHYAKYALCVFTAILLILIMLVIKFYFIP